MARRTLTAVERQELDHKLAAAVWWRDFRSTNNDAFANLLWDQHRYLVLMGGGGSGKSIFAGRKILERVTSEPGHRYLICRKVGKSLRNSCYAQLISQANELYAWAKPRANKSDLTINFANGSQIIMSGLDDVEKLKSIYGITGIWLEEASELLESDFNQLDIRLRDQSEHYQQIIITFNPISATHWLKKRFFDRADPRAVTHRSTYRDNRFLPDEAIRTLESFRETDPYYYQVYALGQWGVTGKTVFDGQAVSDRLALLERESHIIRRGLWEYSLDADEVRVNAPRWTNDNNGPIKIFREPELGHPYVIGGDTAGDGSDSFVAQVLDNSTGEQVAILRHRYDEDTYARQVYCLGKYYNDALIAIETNYSTYPVKMLQKMGYRKLYVREVPDTYDGTMRHSFGFDTNRTTRPLIIGELVRAMRNNIHTIHDTTTLEEMLTFVRPDKNPERPEAEDGAHDDTIMALAIAWYVRPQQSATITPPAAQLTQWTDDQWQDYDAASTTERETLLRRWGKPTPR